MKKVHILGKDEEKVSIIKNKLEEKGFFYVEENPDIVICYGGDGIFLIAERVFPNVPKILIKDSLICNTGQDIPIEKALDLYNKGDYKILEIKKLKANFKGRFEVRELVGVNDIVIRNSLPTEAVRFNIFVNEKRISEKTLIGDGVVIATSYGSSKGAYFHSICRRDFIEGIGIAFNNISEEKSCLILKEDDEIQIEIVRGPAILVADNNRDFINLENGDRISVKQTQDIAKKIVLLNKESSN